ncbi:TPA: hypothetical protein EYP66_00130, partial [Candidatus Poribacteria bacterium]|nr:hypothetical protein [Candidatus Poribacteria bacterium]
MRRILIITTIFLFISATPAHAVIPQFMPIIQMLLSLLPQIALFVLFSISLIFKFSTWRRIFSKATSNPLILAITVIAVVSVGFYFFLFRNTPRMTVSDNISQYAWINFGGNASRTGNVDGKPGPEYGEEIWKFREAIDRAPFISSAAVVDYLSAEESRTLMDIIPYDTIAYLSISNLDAVSQTVVNSPEWKELYSMDEVKEGLAQPEQLMTMLLGLTPEELVKILGHKLVFSFLGIENNLPVACLAIDAGENKGQAQYAIEQLISFTALSGQMTPREDSYREVPYTGISLGEIEIAYGFLDNFVLAGSNGGFEKMVDLYKDGGKNIEDNPNFQFIGKKVNLSSEICLFANVERVIPILPELQKLMDKKAELSEKSEEDEEFQKFLENTVLPSIKGFGISLSLSGIAHKVYLHIEPNTADNPLFNLLLTAHPTMSSIKFLPVDGALVGVQIGDAVTLFDSLLNVAEFFGQNREDIEKKISEAEQTVGLNLRNDLLSALTGEIGVMALLPNGEVNLKKNKLDFAKFRPILLLGINDRYKLEKTASKITQLAQLRTKKLDEEEYRDFKIYTNL